MNPEELKRLQDLEDLMRRHKHEGIQTEKLALTGIVAPGFTPKQIGIIYCDTSAGKVYISTGVTTSSDWKLLN